MSRGKPPTRDWRAQPPTQSVYAREWRSGGKGTASQFSRKFKLRMVGLSLVALLALIVVLFLVPFTGSLPKSQIVTYGISAYDAPVPVNPFAEQDGNAFGELSEVNSKYFFPLRKGDLNATQILESWRKECSSDDIARQHLIVFCTVHAIVQSTGEVKLMAIDATPETRDRMVPLQDLIAILQQSKAKRVLLLLDTARLESNWRLGILCNDVAELIASQWPAQSRDRLQSKSDKVDREPAKGEKLTILLAAGPGQRSWAKGGESSFARVVIDGLAGEADGWIEDDGRAQLGGIRNKRVSLLELTAYSRKRIEEFSHQRYGVLQTIQLLGSVSDFDIAGLTEASKAIANATALAKTKDKKKAALAAANEAVQATEEKAKTSEQVEITWDEKSEKQFEQLWIERDAWRDERGTERPIARRRAPLLWRRFQATLARADSLKQGGQQRHALGALDAAAAAAKRLNEQSSAVAGLNWQKSEVQLLSRWGFAFEFSRPSDLAIAAAGKSLQADPAAGNTEKPNSSEGETVSAASPTEIDPIAARLWLVQELQRDPMTEKDLTRLRQLVERLPATPDALLLRDVLALKANEITMVANELLPQFFANWDQLRRLAVRFPEAWPMTEGDVRAGVRAQHAAERWLFAPGLTRPDVKVWLQKATEAISRAEESAIRYGEAVGIWSDLLSELPAIAEWVAARANDDGKRDLSWLVLWARDAQETGAWDLAALLKSWPERPYDPKDVERKLLSLFIDAQRLKAALFAPAGETLTSEEFNKLVRDARTNRADFWQDVQSKHSRAEIANSTTAQWRESYRLLEQGWIPFPVRDRQKEFQAKLDDAFVAVRDKSKANPTIGELLPTPSTTTGPVWQGFWAVNSMQLLSEPTADCVELCKTWGRLVMASPLPGLTPSHPDVSAATLRQARAGLGDLIREQWTRLPTLKQDLPSIYLIAAKANPFREPERDQDPDDFIRNERQRQFAAWLDLFADQWRGHADDTIRPNATKYFELARDAANLSRALDRRRDANDLVTKPKTPVSPRLPLLSHLAFDANRQSRLELPAVASVAGDKSPNIVLAGSGVRLVEGKQSSTLEKGLTRPMQPDAPSAFSLSLNTSVDVPQQLLVVLADPIDNYPYDFRLVQLNPPFDEKQWKIEFTEAKSKNALEWEPLARSIGVKAFLCPSTNVGLRAELVRSDKDLTTAAKIKVFRLLDSTRTPEREVLIENIDLPLKPGQVRTPLAFDFPEPPKDKPPGNDATSAGLNVDIGFGLVFQIVPEGQHPLEYVIRPTFYSALNFINEPKPVIEDDRLTLFIQRPAVVKEGLLPKSIGVELHVPEVFLESLTGYTLKGAVQAGQSATLAFSLPKNWSDLARDHQLELSLDVAGLPHAYVWRIESSGLVVPISGNPPHLGVRFRMPPPEGKDPPRLKPILKKGKDPLDLLLQLNAAELDRYEAVDGWTVKYTVSRETPTGFEKTPLGKSWPIFSSLQRRVVLDSVQTGVWNVRTDAADYTHLIPESELSGSFGRYQIRAEVGQADESNPLTVVTQRFAIDDEREPEVKFTWAAAGPKWMDQDLAFQIEATDLESGIDRVSYGFDLNGDETFQEVKEMIGEARLSKLGGIELNDPTIKRKFTIPKSKLPSFAKDKQEETKYLMVRVQNGLGGVKSWAEPIPFQRPKKPSVPVKEPTGNLVVRLKINRGAESTIQIKGPDTKTEKTKNNSVTFSNLKPGRYEIKVNVNYAVVGVKESGSETIDVKVDETVSADVTLSTVK
ncbi:carboxypeptidase-like regulatory domain-containing protein [Schlesneria paludicola]|uniref:carboxypeptidase-like regulatory domain-containing protein n=1 Tax=Schlesneria paludicola TaxID=360056 RepID=UPI00029B43E4|nr:carboxypeptidase-like regulatory domain-containing protein [Schlesneria paludicola]